MTSDAEEMIDDETLEEIFKGAQAEMQGIHQYMNYMRAMFAMIAALMIKKELCTADEFKAMEAEARRMSGYGGADSEQAG